MNPLLSSRLMTSREYVHASQRRIRHVLVYAHYNKSAYSYPQYPSGQGFKLTSAQKYSFTTRYTS
jgi:hypothetical protein